MESRLLLIVIAFFISIIFYSYKYLKRTNLGKIDFDELLDSNLPFILYLRTFNDDSIGNKLPTSTFNLLNLTKYSFEEEIAYDLKEHLLITVGKPNEKFPQLGSLRLYLNNKDWKEKVSTLIEKSQKVIIKPANSEGFEWELNNILENNYLQKLIIFNKFSNLNNIELNTFYYNNFRKKILQQYNIEMSDYQNKMRYNYFDDRYNHIQSLDLKSFNILNKTTINLIKDFKHQKNYSTPLKKFSYSIFNIISHILILIFLFCFVYMIFSKL